MKRNFLKIVSFIVFTFLCISILGSFIYGEYFTPTTLIVCTHGKVDKVIIESRHGLKLSGAPNSKGVARFENISKGEWHVVTKYKDQPEIDSVTLLVDGLGTQLNCPNK